MSQEIINRVANSKLETIDLEHFFPKIERVSFDIKPWLKDELFLLEKDFREKVKNFDWRKYKNKAVYIICSNDAIVPDWAYILISSQLNTFNVRNVIGSKEVLNVKLITEIVDAFDGIMVARGDLGVEVPLEVLPRIQRRIIRTCAEMGKRAIVATHMLESMIENPIPTRAEVTDVANAVYEESDAIMLSGETTIGKYPVKCVEILDRIARSTESSRGLLFTDNLVIKEDKQQIAKAAVNLIKTSDDSSANILFLSRKKLLYSVFKPPRSRADAVVEVETKSGCK